MTYNEGLMLIGVLSCMWILKVTIGECIKDAWDEVWCRYWNNR
jgi:hypothetical protein